MTRSLHFGYKCVDLDVGEFFLNYNLHQELVPYPRGDLTNLWSEIQKELGHTLPPPGELPLPSTTCGLGTGTHLRCVQGTNTLRKS